MRYARLFLLASIVTTFVHAPADARPRRTSLPELSIGVQTDNDGRLIMPQSQNSNRPVNAASGRAVGITSNLVAVAARYVGTNPTGWRALWCGRFMRKVVTEAGYPDFKRGDSAIAWKDYGRRTHAKPGAIGVITGGRRNHVAVVVHVEGNRAYTLSGNHNRTTAYAYYPLARFVAFVDPG